MKLNVKEIEKAVGKLKLLLQDADDVTRMTIYCGLMKECLDKNRENINWAGQQWVLLLSRKIEILEKREKDLDELEREKSLI